jgi:hypothetical protein
MKLLLIAVCLLPLSCYSQKDTSKQVVGKMYSMSGPYAYWVSVILHRNKQAIVAIQTDGNSLQEIFDEVERERIKLGKDVVATYEHITFQKSGSKKVQLNVRLYNRTDTVPKSRAIDEINGLKNYNFISGNIYFSGAGFPKATAVRASDKVRLETYYDRCAPGTVITLGNCVHQNWDKSVSEPLNKLIKLN